MSITVTYDSALSSIGGLADYLAYYESTFNLDYHYETGGFSSASSTPVSVGGVNYGSTYSDLQYASESSATGQTSAFIAEAAAGGQLTYSLFNSPTHTLFGHLDTLTFGADLASSGGLWSLAETYLSIDGLDSVLNAGIDANGNVIPWGTGNNDVHNVIYPLLSGSTSGLEAVFNSEGITLVGTSGDDEFDSFAAADIFVSNGGEDAVNNFDTADTLDLTGFGFADTAEALAFADNSSGLYTIISDGTNSITLLGYTGTLTEANIIV